MYESTQATLVAPGFSLLDDTFITGTLESLHLSLPLREEGAGRERRRKKGRGAEREN